MIRLNPIKIATTILRNQAHRLGITRALNRVIGRSERGDAAWSRQATEVAGDHVLEVFHLVRRYTGDPRGKVGLEIGPGDNLGVAYGFLKQGCAKMIAVEQYDSVKLDAKAAALLRYVDERLDAAEGEGVDPETRADRVLREDRGSYALDPDRLVLSRALFEEVRPADAIDFIYSNDVIEHVADLDATFLAAHRLLKPGGLFVNSIDLAGHNAFDMLDRPLDFLTCPDWLWGLMFSHMVTTNRVRFSDLVEVAIFAGFRVKQIDVLVRAEPGYLDAVRPHLLPRYRALPDEDLSVVQCMLVTEKEAHPPVKLST
jgi:SAM-dependent methyltransferase